MLELITCLESQAVLVIGHQEALEPLTIILKVWLCTQSLTNVVFSHWVSPVWPQVRQCQNLTAIGMKGCQRAPAIQRSLKANNIVKLDLLMTILGWLFLVTFISLEMVSIGLVFGFFFCNFHKNWDEADQPVVFMILQVLFLVQGHETWSFHSRTNFLVHHDIPAMVAGLLCHPGTLSFPPFCSCVPVYLQLALDFLHERTVPLFPDSVAHTSSGRLRRRPYQ